MFTFHNTATELQHALKLIAILECSKEGNPKTIEQSSKTLNDHARALYSSHVTTPGLLAYQELIQLYKTIVEDVRNITKLLYSEVGYVESHTITDRSLVVCSIKDPALLDVQPTHWGELAIYQLRLIEDVVRLLIFDQTLPHNSVMINRYIFLNYPHVISLLTDYLSFQGATVPANIQYLWDHGYFPVARIRGERPPFIELPLPGLVILHIPIRSTF